MSARRASGASRPSLGAQVLAVFSFISQDDGKGGLGLRGVAFMTVLTVGGSGEHLALLLLVLQNTVPRDDRDGFGGFGGCGGFGRDGYPLKLNPPFSSS